LLERWLQKRAQRDIYIFFRISLEVHTHTKNKRALKRKTAEKTAESIGTINQKGKSYTLTF